MAKIQRSVEKNGKWREEVAYGVKNLPGNMADAAQLLEINQKH